MFKGSESALSILDLVCKNGVEPLFSFSPFFNYFLLPGIDMGINSVIGCVRNSDPVLVAMD